MVDDQLDFENSENYNALKMTHHANYVEILHRILDNIAYSKESNDVTLLVLNPLIELNKN